MLKHRPRNFYDDPKVHLPTDHGRNKILDRSQSIPPDSVVELEKSLYAKALWADPKRTLKLLELSRSPILTSWEIARMLNQEFKETRFTLGACTGRLDRLRQLSKGIYGRNRIKRIPPLES